MNPQVYYAYRAEAFTMITVILHTSKSTASKILPNPLFVKVQQCSKGKVQ